jgi:hypothetical protein
MNATYENLLKNQVEHKTFNFSTVPWAATDNGRTVVGLKVEVLDGTFARRWRLLSVAFFRQSEGSPAATLCAMGDPSARW